MSERMEGKRSIEDIAATQAEHTLFLARIVEHLDEHTALLKGIETAIQLLAGGITNMRTELLVVKAHINTIAENTHTDLGEDQYPKSE